MFRLSTKSINVGSLKLSITHNFVPQYKARTFAGDGHQSESKLINFLHELQLLKNKYWKNETFEKIEQKSENLKFALALADSCKVRDSSYNSEKSAGRILAKILSNDTVNPDELLDMLSSSGIQFLLNDAQSFKDFISYKAHNFHTRIEELFKLKAIDKLGETHINNIINTAKKFEDLIAALPPTVLISKIFNMLGKEKLNHLFQDSQTIKSFTNRFSSFYAERIILLMENLHTEQLIKIVRNDPTMTYEDFKKYFANYIPANQSQEFTFSFFLTKNNAMPANWAHLFNKPTTIRSAQEEKKEEERYDFGDGSDDEPYRGPRGLM